MQIFTQGAWMGTLFGKSYNLRQPGENSTASPFANDIVPFQSSSLVTAQDFIFNEVKFLIGEPQGFFSLQIIAGADMLVNFHQQFDDL